MKDLNLHPMGQGRLRGDTVKAFKILRRLTGVEPKNMFRQVTGGRAQRNSANLWQVSPRSNVLANVSCNRVVGAWHHLSSEIVSTEGVDAIKTLPNQIRLNLCPVCGSLYECCCRAD